MKETDLDRLIRSIGMKVFVQFYEEFRNPNISDQEMVERLPAEYTLKSRRTRTTKARRILRESLKNDALWMIVDADRVDDETARRVRVLLKIVTDNRSEQDLLSEIAATERRISELRSRLTTA